MNIDNKIFKGKSGQWFAMMVVAVAMLSACEDFVPPYLQDVEDGEHISTEFEWQTTKSADITLTSPVDTKVYIYADKACKNLVCSQVLNAEETTTIHLTRGIGEKYLYLSYVNEDGEKVVKTIDLIYNKVTTRANVAINLVDAATLTASTSDIYKISPSSQEFGTLMFEDNYPTVGDYDMNDLVLGYYTAYRKDADVVEVFDITLQLRALGGTLPYVPGIELIGVDSATDIDVVEYTKSEGKNPLSVRSLADEDRSGTPVFVVDGCRELNDGTGFYNVKQIVDEAELPCVTIHLERYLGDNRPSKLNIDDKDINFFIINTNTNIEIHERGYQSTRFAANKGEDFVRSKDVWALRFIGYTPHPKENVQIEKAFKDFNKWKNSGSGVVQYTDWYSSCAFDYVISYDRRNNAAAPNTSAGSKPTPSISVKNNSINVSAEGGEVVIPVTANCDYDVFCSKSSGVYDYHISDGNLKLYFNNNYNAEGAKSSSITLVSVEDSKVSCSIAVSQATQTFNGAQMWSGGEFAAKIVNPLTAKFGKTKADVKHIVIKSNDETYNQYNTSNPNSFPDNVAKCHNRAEAIAIWDDATNTLTITTSAPAIKCANNFASSMFKDMTSLEDVDFAGLDFSNVTTTEQMFFGCTSLKSVDLRKLNSQKVNSMNSMFRNCPALETVHMEGFNTSKVTKMANMFDGCKSLKSMDMSSWDIPLMENMNTMFANCIALKEVKMNFDKTSLTRDGITKLFLNCSSLEEVDMSTFDSNSADRMYKTFEGCSSLKKVIFGPGLANHTSLLEIFQYAGTGDFECVNADFSSVTSMNRIFNGSKATSINLSGWKTDNLQYMDYSFCGCTNAKSINLSGWSCDNAIKFFHPFDNCSIIEDINFGTEFNIPSTTDILYIFYSTAKTSKNTTVKCSKETYNTLKTSRTDHSKEFLNNYVHFVNAATGNPF